MKSRKEAVREYKERSKTAGVFVVKNLANGKVLLGSSLNIEGPLNAHRFMLKIGQHRNAELQRDWDALGADSFAFEVLETVAASDDPGFDVDGELELLEEIWLEKLQPFGERGYNKSEKIRQA